MWAADEKHRRLSHTYGPLSHITQGLANKSSTIVEWPHIQFIANRNPWNHRNLISSTQTRSKFILIWIITHPCWESTIGERTCHSPAVWHAHSFISAILSANVQSIAFPARRPSPTLPVPIPLSISIQLGRFRPSDETFALETSIILVIKGSPSIIQSQIQRKRQVRPQRQRQI